MCLLNNDNFLFPRPCVLPVVPKIRPILGGDLRPDPGRGPAALCSAPRGLPSSARLLALLPQASPPCAQILVFVSENSGTGRSLALKPPGLAHALLCLRNSPGMTSFTGASDLICDCWFLFASSLLSALQRRDFFPSLLLICPPSPQASRLREMVCRVQGQLPPSDGP